MASRGRQTFNKRLKEQQRKEKQQEKFARKLQRKFEPKEDPDAVPTEDPDNSNIAAEGDVAVEPENPLPQPPNQP